MAKPTIKLRPKTQPVSSATKTQTALPEALPVIAERAYFRPKKKQISIRMDADVLAWFQAQPGKYQQLINKACRLYMETAFKCVGKH